MTENILAKAIEASNKANRAQIEDYFGNNGLLYCGKCHTPKQFEIDDTFSIDKLKGLRINCLCECASKAVKEREAAEKERKRQEHIKELKRKCFRGETRLLSATFENDDKTNPKLTQLARQYVSSFPALKQEGKGLLLYGAVDQGKSFTAACIANAILETNTPVLMSTFGQIEAELQKDFNGRSQYYQELTDYPLLIIDDFGAERNTEYMQEIVYTVINNRYSANRPLILTSNLSAREIQSQSDESTFYKRVYSRIFSCCMAYEVTGKQHRLEQARLTKANMNSLFRIN